MSEEIKKLPALLSETPSKIVQSRGNSSHTPFATAHKVEVYSGPLG